MQECVNRYYIAVVALRIPFKLQRRANWNEVASYKRLSQIKDKNAIMLCLLLSHLNFYYTMCAALGRHATLHVNSVRDAGTAFHCHEMPTFKDEP
jgi:hypothetical protein